jgi:hypothetical protein
MIEFEYLPNETSIALRKLASRFRSQVEGCLADRDWGNGTIVLSLEADHTVV